MSGKSELPEEDKIIVEWLINLTDKNYERNSSVQRIKDSIEAYNDTHRE